MDKYIKLDDAIRTAIQAVCAFNISREGVGITQFDAVDVADRMKMIPPADVAEVKHGEWIDKPTGAYGRWQSWCSACGKHSGIGGITSNQHKPFCPNCGADMRG